MAILRIFLLGWLLAAAPTPAAAQPAPDDAQRTLELLQDPARRDQLIRTLETIAQTGQPPAPAPTSAAAPNNIGADVLLGVSRFLNHVSHQAVAALAAVRSIPLLWGWLRVMATDDWARGVLIDVAWRLGVVLLIGIAVQWGVSRVVHRPIMLLIRRAPNGNGTQPVETGEARAEHGETEPPRPSRRLAALLLLRRVPLVTGRFILELLPVAGFLLITHLLAATALGGVDPSRVVLLAVIDAYALTAALLCIARLMFSPDAKRLRLLSIPDDAAAYAMRWSRRIVVVSVFGYAISSVGLLLGLSDAAHDALLKLVGLLDHIFLGIIVVQQRRPVRRALRAPPGATGLIAGLRNQLARNWHWLALVLLAALWLTWAIEVPHGFTEMLRFVASLLLVTLLARLLLIVLLGGLDRFFAQEPDAVGRYPGLQARLALYHPVLVSVTRGLVLLLAVITLLQLWGLGGWYWLMDTVPGRRLLSTLLTLAVTVLLAIATWEAVNAGIERHLDRLTREAQAARSARLRTLLPLLRTTLLITILIVAGMMVLSEIGVNIGPLLAGAGIVGVAVGFGSQKLVQDLITGIFLLLENAMQVGDNVTVSGLTGTVENLSVRTIRLRASDGSVHIIPFSSVTTVTNVNRGLGNASVTVSVAADEDTDRVSEVLKGIVAGMREDADCSPKILSDLQLWGVDEVNGASATIKGQVVCTDSGRWSVQRELNRRMKQRFAELGIKLYNPMQHMVAMRQIKDPEP